MGLSVLTWIKLGVALVAFAAVALFYWHYESLVAERDQLMLDKASQARTIESQGKQIEDDKLTVAKWDAALKAANKRAEALQRSRKEAQEHASRFEKLFGSVDLRREAHDSPDALAARLNSGFADAMRMWGCDSGDGPACFAPAAPGGRASPAAPTN